MSRVIGFGCKVGNEGRGKVESISDNYKVSGMLWVGWFGWGDD